MKKLGLLSLIMLLLQVFLPLGIVGAEENTTQLILGSTVKGEITQDADGQVYQFTINKPSRVT